METQVYWNERNARMDADIKSANEYAKTDDAKMHRLQIERSAAAESGRDTIEVDAQIEAMHDAKRTAFLAKWPLELTVTRRAEWNTLVKSGKISDRKGKVDFKALRQQEQAQGWAMDELKQAVKAHGL